ncbi:rhamnosyltransferase [Propionispira arboris]|uniref:Rhamnosyltransferase n=1 Tax=Propionispira arboris TaxID=84035 RepID=A0A1H7CDD1_9FIRM|nr:rhamnan synthesis F family protein [Propionispira arboris]SEJ87699.1 rhamnosyltransferase [Propionispira arboris]
MIPPMKQTNRIGVFVLSDETGTVDDSDIYLLDMVKENLSCLYIGCRTKRFSLLQETLQHYTTDIYQLANNLTEVECYKFLLEKIDQKHLYIYDELFFFDNSFFGPFYGLQEIFFKMQEKNCDFWGLLCQDKMVDENWNDIDQHLCGGFLAVRSSLFKTLDFIKFFNSSCYSMKSFLNYFCELGYQFETYVDIKQYSSALLQNNLDYERYLSYELIHDLKYPILKKSCLKINDKDFSYGTGESITNAMKYIDEYLPYNIDLIWESILRKENIVDLRNLLHINYILPSRIRYAREDKNPICKKAVVLIHLYYMDLLDEVFLYIDQIPKDIDIIITSLEKNHEMIWNKAKSIGRENLRVLPSGNRGRDIAALLVTAKPYLLQYEYLCFLHDKKTSGDSGAVTVGKSFRYMIWENLLKSEAYIGNILDTFDRNPRLGFLSPPEPYHADHFHVMGNEWTTNYKITKGLLDMLGVRVKLHKDKGPFALSSSFWCRTKALKKLFQHSFAYEDFPTEPLPLDGTISHAIERCFIFIAQYEGYFSGIVENEEYTAMHITDMQRMLSKVICLESHEKYFSSFYGLCSMFVNDGLSSFCEKYKNIYIYGAGAFGHRLLNVLKKRGIDVRGFIISDGQKMKENIDLRCYYLSQVLVTENTGIVIAATKKYQNEILQELRAKGHTNLFYKYI